MAVQPTLRSGHFPHPFGSSVFQTGIISKHLAKVGKTFSLPLHLQRKKNLKQTSTVLCNKTWCIGQMSTIHGNRERLMENMMFDLGYKKSGAWNRVRGILLTYFGLQLSHPAITYFLCFSRGSLYSPASYSPQISAGWISHCACRPWHWLKLS